MREPPRPAVIRENPRLHSYQAGNPGYSGSEQARPAFAVLAVVAATAAAIALASRARARGTSGAAEGGEPVRCGSLRDT